MKEKILIVDDTEFHQKAYQKSSSRWDTSPGSQKRGGGPDLILLDLMMPVVDGFKGLQMIKANPDLQNIPIFSAKGASEEIGKAP